MEQKIYSIHLVPRMLDVTPQTLLNWERDRRYVNKAKKMIKELTNDD